MSAGNDREFIDYLQAKEKEAKAMKCPLFTIMDKRTQLGEESDYCECLKEECAWWAAYDKSCVLISLNIEMRVIRATLKDMEYKMPHEVQFRK